MSGRGDELGLEPAGPDEKQAERERLEDRRDDVTPAADRDPLVGTAADGCRRSAQICREELDTLGPDDRRRPFLEGEVAYWNRRALAEEARHG